MSSDRCSKKIVGSGSAHCRAQQPYRVRRVRRHRHPPADRVRKNDLRAQRVPRVAHVLAESARHAHDDRRGEPVRRAPAHRAAVVELLGRGIGVLAKLDLGHRHQPADRHSYGAADDALLGQTRVEDPIDAERLLQAFGHQVHAALHADVLAEHDELRIAREFRAQRAAHGVGKAKHLTVRGRRLRSAERGDLGLRQAARRRGVARLR